MVNFSSSQSAQTQLQIPVAALQAMGLGASKSYTYTDLLNQAPPLDHLTLTLAPQSARVLEIKAE